MIQLVGTTETRRCGAVEVFDMRRCGICKSSIGSMFPVLMAMFQALNGMDIRYGKCNRGGFHIYSEEIPFLNRSKPRMKQIRECSEFIYLANLREVELRFG
jgi:hypothetical protein